eukprot:216877-Chlamydomonas_euryale.AAC.3
MATNLLFAQCGPHISDAPEHWVMTTTRVICTHGQQSCSIGQPAAHAETHAGNSHGMFGRINPAVFADSHGNFGLVLHQKAVLSLFLA